MLQLHSLCLAPCFEFELVPHGRHASMALVGAYLISEHDDHTAFPMPEAKVPAAHAEQPAEADSRAYPELHRQSDCNVLPAAIVCECV